MLELFEKYKKYLPAAIGVVAAVLIVVTWILCPSGVVVVEVNYDYANLIEVKHIVVVCAGLMVVGVLMCALAALLAANRFISLNYDELYTK